MPGRTACQSNPYVRVVSIKRKYATKKFLGRSVDLLFLATVGLVIACIFQIWLWKLALLSILLFAVAYVADSRYKF